MTLWGYDQIDAEVLRVLGILAQGLPASGLESQQVDLKEEAGRRHERHIGPSIPHNEKAAKSLAAAAACMANTDRGGVLIIGVGDNGEIIGTQLDEHWLRQRIFVLTDRQLTVDIRPTELRGERILLLRSPEAVEPIRFQKRITWRVGDSCVDVDASTWHARRLSRVDWSAQSSGILATAVRPTAVQRAKDYLREYGDPRSVELAGLDSTELLVRLNAVLPSGELTNAAAIAFIGRPQAPAFDYLRRDYSGGESRQRVRLENIGAIEELYEIERTAAAYNPTTHIGHALIVGQFRDIPETAMREAIVNGCVHRNWMNSEATVIEHVGKTLTVTSPGGFPEGVTAENVMTHPSTSRNRALVQLFADLRIAEKQGVGVDRIIRELVRTGRSMPFITEIPGPFVRVALHGGPPDPLWLGWLAQLRPEICQADLTTILLMRHLVDFGWIDAERAVPILQVDIGPAELAINALTAITMGGEQVLLPVRGTPANSSPAWRLASTARLALGPTANLVRERVAMNWAQARGRISSTELASIVGGQPSNLGRVLKSLQRQGLLSAGRASSGGPGFFYQPVAQAAAAE